MYCLLVWELLLQTLPVLLLHDVHDRGVHGHQSQDVVGQTRHEETAGIIVSLHATCVLYERDLQDSALGTGTAGVANGIREAAKNPGRAEHG